MANINQIQNGIVRYLDTDIISKMTGWQRWVFGAGASLAVANLSTTIDRWRSNEIVKMLGVVSETGDIDVPKVYQSIKQQSARGPITFDIPGMGSLTLNDADVDRIYNFIMTTGG